MTRQALLRTPLFLGLIAACAAVGAALLACETEEMISTSPSPPDVVVVDATTPADTPFPVSLTARTPGASDTASQFSCENGVAVPNPATNPELVADCEALLVIRDQLAGDADLDWSTNLEVDEWQGVETDESTGRVSALILPKSGLLGQLTAELGRLSGLRLLWVSGNNLSGAIPPELGDLIELTTLDLGGNQLTGSIPPEIGKIAGLKRLDLRDNSLTGRVPNELAQLVDLESLILSANSLSGEIPSDLWKLRNLSDLQLRGNSLTGCVTDALMDVRNQDLDDLGLPVCDHEASQPGFLCAQGLAVPDPESNPGLASDCTTLLSIRDALKGDLELNWSAQIKIADWDGVTVHPSTNRVTALDMGQRYLQGAIPRALGRLDFLKSLSLVGNRLTGETPAELANLKYLTHLDLSGNRLSGEIPAELGQLANLQGLNLAHNGLTGPIPESLGGLTKLEFFGAANNRLVGEISVELGNLRNLTALDLSSNGLNGNIPVELGYLENLVQLKLSENMLSGEIPVELGDLDKLEVLKLDNNQLTGEVPTELGNLVNLRQLLLQDNMLTGAIPSELGDLSDLRAGWILLSGNNLSGCVPGAFRHSNVSDLAMLQLPFCDDPSPAAEGSCAIGDAVNEPASNPGLIADCFALLGAKQYLGGRRALNWSASLDMEAWRGVTILGTPKRATLLNLSRHQLDGSIPPELGLLTELTVLDLSDNQLTGQIPEELGVLSNLRLLLIDGNELQGEIPTSLGLLDELVVLNIGRNKLSGKIPTEFENLTKLDKLYLSGNELDGCVPDRLRRVGETDFADVGLSFCGEVDASRDRSVLEALSNATDVSKGPKR